MERQTETVNNKRFGQNYDKSRQEICIKNENETENKF